MKNKITVWDWPLRLFHWSLFLAVTTSYISIKYYDAIEIHVISGIIITALLVFRIIWGFCGSSTSRFVNFIPTLPKLIKFLKNNSPNKSNTIGHNPLGSISVIALLSSLTIQSLSGLVIDDEIYTTGPLNKYVSNQIADIASVIHHTNSNVLFGLILLHLIAIGFYYFRKKIDLIGPMLTGKKSVNDNSLVGITKPNSVLLFITILLAVSVGYFLYSLI